MRDAERLLLGIRTRSHLETPEEVKLRQLDALEGMRRLMERDGPVPEWVGEMRERVERGEL